MKHGKQQTFLPMTALVIAVLLVAVSWLNTWAKREAAELPDDYYIPLMHTRYESQPGTPRPEAHTIDGKPIPATDYIPFLLLEYSPGDTVLVTDADNAAFPPRRVALVRRFTDFEILTSVIVSGAFLIFALVVALRYSRRSYAGVLSAVAFGTSTMVMLDWGSRVSQPVAAAFLLLLLFDAAIWFIPTLFFHFSCIYPTVKPKPRAYLLPVWYGISIAGFLVSALYLISMFTRGVPVQHTYYIELHGVINDVFVVAGLLATVANLEHSTLYIESARQRMNVYWILFGIILGPLVYVFMILVPRTLMSQEFVSDAMMEYALLIAPVTFYYALRRNGSE